MKITTAAMIGMLLATPVAADVAVRFDEGAPTDRFTFTALDQCLTGPVKLTIDLSGSLAGLIFDVTPQGAGVQVFQPFVLVAGENVVSAVPDVRDGDTVLTMGLKQLIADQSVAFTIDVDDTTGGREITVNGAEISGAKVTLTTHDTEFSGVFSDQASALIETPACTS
jgi:hypothetical protein